MSRRHPGRPEEDRPTVDLEAQLVSARYDLQLLGPAYRAAYESGLGYGPKAIDYARQRYGVTDPAVSNVPISFSPERHDDDGCITDVGGDPWSTPTAHGVRRSLTLLAQAQHDYGDLPDGQTVWPTTPIDRRDVTLTEALQGVTILDACLHQLQIHRTALLGQEQSVALQVADGCRAALRAIPERLWRKDLVATRRPCLDCGSDVQDKARRCWACRQRIHRAVKAAADAREAS